MKSNKNILNYYVQLFGLNRYAQFCKFNYDAIADADGVNDCVTIGVGQLVIQIDNYLFERDDGSSYVIAVMNIDAVSEQMQGNPENYNIWEHFQSVLFGGATNNIKLMFDMSNGLQRHLYNELIKTILEPSV